MSGAAAAEQVCDMSMSCQSAAACALHCQSLGYAQTDQSGTAQGSQKSDEMDDCVKLALAGWRCSFSEWLLVSLCVCSASQLLEHSQNLCHTVTA